jgi:hypothetical protein
MITEIITGALGSLFGLYLILLATGAVSASKNPDTEEYHAWRSKYQAVFIITGVISICSGLYKVIVAIWFTPPA